MDAEKIRNLTDAELAHQQRELNDQLFRLKFQLKMGQTESLNKIRGLRKDVARIKTILREKDLGLSNGAKQTASPAEPAAEKKAAPAKKAASAKKKTASAKKSAGAKAKARK
jgi:large subunit ribosomal protein L29